MPYQYPLEETRFLLEHLLQFDNFCQQMALEEVNSELAVNILEEADRFGSEQLAPLNWSGNQQGVRLTEQGVQEADGFREAYQQFAEGGWLSLTSPESLGGQNLPQVISMAVNEIWNAANMSFALCPLLTQSAIESLEHHGSDEQQQKYLTQLISGNWTGTMNLTEPDAGTDLAAVKTRAVPHEDHYHIKGQKIFITWGDHQMAENIVHLVLARLPDAPAGVKGISLFLVPKFLLNAAGEPDTRNAVNCLSTEEKLGIHASPTCVMEYQNAVGFLIGEPHKGLNYMFTMMNHARQAVGLQGLAISDRSYQQALQFAKERVQGTRRDGSRIRIIEHADVRRMLMLMKSLITAMRSLALTAALEIDSAEYSKDPEQKTRHQHRVELYTPIVKGWLTEIAQELTSLGIQIHGGMGFIEETGIAQHYRDARILPIYEGTNGIQGLDFIGRKVLANEGRHLQALLDDMQQTLNELEEKQTQLPQIYQAFNEALQHGKAAHHYVISQASQDADIAGGVCFNFLMLFGYLTGGWMMARIALASETPEAQESVNPDFLSAQQASTRFYCEHVLPRTYACLKSMQSGKDHFMDLSEEQF